MNKSVWTVAKLNLKNLTNAYLATAIITIAFSSQYVSNAILSATGEDLSEQIGLSGGWAIWLLIVLAAIIVPTRNFNRIINLGGKRRNYFWGSLITYAVLAGAISLVGTVIFYALDLTIINAGRYGDIATVPEVFGWNAHGPIVAFVQQWAFLFLLATFTHTLAAAQGKWYGWAADIAIIAVISVFTPIAPLRSAEAWFFNLILFHHSALLQIVACIILAIAVYMLSKPILARKAA